MKNILVIGAGACGSALANLICNNLHNVFLSANKKEIVDEINQKNTNQKFLPQAVLSHNIKAIEGFENKIKECDLVFIACPSSAVIEVFNQISSLNINNEIGFVICSKGLDSNSLSFFSEVFENIFPSNNLAILSGPNFAIEIANKTPSITTIASTNYDFANEVIEVLNNDFFFAKYSKSPVFAEVCGVIKNIMAIGCGIIDGLNLGQNTKAALVNKGIEEILLLCEALKIETDLTTPACFGDIFLTCASFKSRNNALGVMLASGKGYAEISKENHKTFEGAIAAKSMVNLAKKLKIELILSQTIAQILDSSYNTDEIKNLIIKAIF